MLDGKGEGLIDAIEIDRLESPLTEDESWEVPPGTSERIWDKIQSKLDDGKDN